MAVGKALPRRKYLSGVLKGGKSLHDEQGGKGFRKRKLISLILAHMI